MRDRVASFLGSAAKEARKALAPVGDHAAATLEPVMQKGKEALERIKATPFVKEATTLLDEGVARATVLYAEVSGFTAVQQQRAVVHAAEAELSSARQAFSEAESVLKTRRTTYEHAQATATEQISEFNLNPDLPGHVKEYVQACPRARRAGRMRTEQQPACNTPHHIAPCYT